MMKNHRLAIDDKARCIEQDSPWVTNASKPGKSKYRHLRGFAVAAAILIVPILTVHKTPAAGGAPGYKSGNGATAPWEKTAGPPGITVTVIYKANNIVYAGTETQGIYKSTDEGLTWSAANNGIERASISDIISSGGNLLAAASSSCSS